MIRRVVFAGVFSVTFPVGRKLPNLSMCAVHARSRACWLLRDESSEDVAV